MKSLLYFLPSILVMGFLTFLLLALGDPSTDPQDYLAGAGILLVFLLSDFLLSRKLWFGCIPGAFLGAYVICYGYQYHGQVMDETPVGTIIFAYYAIVGMITLYRRKNTTKRNP